MREALGSWYDTFSDEDRFRVIRGLSDLGAEWHYTGLYLTVSMPRSTYAEVRRFLSAWGLVCDSQACWFFPLGSDNPCHDLRWNCQQYTGYGFWYREGWRAV